MVSGIGWIDFSKDDRDILKSILDALAEPGIVDELGIGSIRNSISDRLFPGISTVQTRAKYFVLVPQMIAEYESNQHKKRKFLPLESFLKERENEIIKELAEKYGGTKETGIIGIDAARRNEELQRKPSLIYWNGIRTHGLIETTLGFSEYLGNFSTQQVSIRIESKNRNSEQDFDDNDIGYRNQFGLTLPNRIRTIDKNLSIDLSNEEAEYLKEKFSDKRTNDSNLLSEIMKNINLAKDFTAFTSFRSMVQDFKTKEIPKEVIRVMECGEAFDFIVHGAHVRYNFLLDEDLAKDKWIAWQEELSQRKSMVRNFDIPFLKSLTPKTKTWTLVFISDWLEELKKDSLDEKALDSLIKDQEKKNKRNLARLSMYDAERTNKWVGLGDSNITSSMSYRFGNVKRIVEDILKGLNNESC